MYKNMSMKRKIIPTIYPLYLNHTFGYKTKKTAIGLHDIHKQEIYN